ncbi:hypothetical protein Y032_0646g1088 [Ancylostoma ceylanicum]|nr:hypothetical protein Y032_0646g1088 [Ancylostoma ceylanicum]
MLLLIVAIAICLLLYVYLQQQAAQGDQPEKESVRTAIPGKVSKRGEPPPTAPPQVSALQNSSMDFL